MVSYGEGVGGDVDPACQVACFKKTVGLCHRGIWSTLSGRGLVLWPQARMFQKGRGTWATNVILPWRKGVARCGGACVGGGHISLSGVWEAGYLSPRVVYVLSWNL